MGRRKRIIMSGVMLGGLCASLWSVPMLLQKVDSLQSGAGMPGMAGVDGLAVSGLDMSAASGEGKGLMVVVPNGEGLSAEARAALLREAEKQRPGREKGSKVVRVVRD